MYLKHVLYPPSMRMKPDREPAFFALAPAVDALGNTKETSSNSSIVRFQLEFERLLEALDNSQAHLKRSVNLRKKSTDL